MHRYENVREAETVAFIAANLAFGRREQILSHVEQILGAAGKSPCDWILTKKYENFFPKNENSFYRMYTNRDMRIFFDCLRKILEKSDTIGDFFKEKWEKKDFSAHKKIASPLPACWQTGCLAMTDTSLDSNVSVRANREIYLHQVIAASFPNCKLLPHSKDSAAKKLNMLHRWLVRTDSPVDLGLWTWFSKKDLLMPLDTHVMQQSNALGLISSKSANLKTALDLTKKAAEIFPGDPLKADYALFGLGVALQEEVANCSSF